MSGTASAGDPEVQILVVIGKLGGGGAERVTATWVAGLVQRGHDVSILTYVEPMPAGMLPGVGRTHVTLNSKLQRWVGLPTAIRRQISTRRPEAVLGVLDFSNLAVLIAAMGIPKGRRPAVVLSEHTVMSLLLRSYGLAGFLRSALGRGLYRRADAAIGVSHAVATDLVATYRLPTDRVYVLPNPLTLPPLLPDSTSRTRPLATKGLRLCFVGRLVPAKRPHLVLDTAAVLQERGYSCTVQIIGDGPENQSLVEHSQRLGLEMRITGWVDDWRVAAAEADCLVLPSLVEGFGVVLTEAAAAGIPCVAPSSALGVADAIVPGLTGALALSARPEDLADAVLEATALHSPVALEGWLRRFSDSSTVDGLERVLKRVVADRGRLAGNG